MATHTLGTETDSSLTAVTYSQSTVTLLPADLATVAQAILDDQNVAHPIVSGAFRYNGLLFIPNRGVLKVFAGDVVAVDATGWPILLSANAIASLSPASSRDLS